MVSNHKYTIPTMDSSGPKPTVGAIPEGAVLINLGPEAGKSVIIKEHREPTILGVMRRAANTVPSPIIITDNSRGETL